MSQVQKMSLLSFITIGLLLTLNSVDLNISWLTDLLLLFGIDTITREFSVLFYREAFPRILFTMSILVFSPLLINLYDIAKKSLLRFYDQNYSYNRRVTRKIVQEEYVQIQSGSKFLFDFRLSTMVSIIYVVFFYAVATPLLYPVSCAMFFVFYWKDKFFLIRNYYVRPQAYEGSLIQFVDDYLVHVLAVHFIGGMFLFNNKAIWANQPQQGRMKWDFFGERHQRLFVVINVSVLILYYTAVFAIPYFQDQKDQGIATLSDDFYNECSQSQLYAEFLEAEKTINEIFNELQYPYHADGREQNAYRIISAFSSAQERQKGLNDYLKMQLHKKNVICDKLVEIAR